MIDRRRVVRLSLGLPATLLLAPSSANAQAFQRFVPFLVDLEGWQGQKPDGLAMEMTGSSMITATREYRRPPAHMQAQILIGQAAKGVLAPMQAAMSMQTGEGYMNTSTINGFKVMRTYNNKEKSGAILVALGDSSVLSFSFNGIADDEELKLAEKFDWKAIQAAVNQK
jgi:hypothetical protein